MVFPVDKNLKAVISSGPEGLVVSEPVMKEFLDPPRLRGDWFIVDVYNAAMEQMDSDDAVSGAEYSAISASMNKIFDALESWAKQRPEMKNGFADAIPQSMRAQGALAWTEIRTLSRTTFASLKANPSLDKKTMSAIENLTSVVWEYVQSAALELEASLSQVDVRQARSLLENLQKSPWEPPVEPTTPDIAAAVIGGSRMPQLPGVPDISSPGTTETDPPSTEDPPEDPNWEPAEPLEPPSPEGGEGI